MPQDEPDFREAAIALLAVDAVLGDDMTCEQAVASARRQASALTDDPTWTDGKHGGDCTSQPHTCMRCVVEQAEQDARTLYEQDVHNLVRSLDRAQKKRAALERSLREAPMPYRESILKDEEWDDYYDEWWHRNASEAALAEATDDT